ncbi:MAG: glycosyltransferase, partial [Acidimicrobiales bacterium]
MTTDTGSEAPRLSVVMVNYNTTELAVDSLQSLRRLVGHDGIEVIFVDNASRGFEPGAVLAAWPEARIVASDENLGFGRGNNLGAEVARGEYLWLLNTDTLIPEDHGLWSMVAFLDDHPDYAAVSPLLADDDGTVQPWQTA